MNNAKADYSSGEQGDSGQSLLSLVRLAKGLEERIEQALGEVQLSVAKYGVLGHLVDAGHAIPLSELAARVNCVRSNVTQMVDRLEADGLVRRTLDPADRRVVLADLTDEGRRRHAAGAERIRVLEKQMEKTIGPADRKTIRRAMQALE